MKTMNPTNESHPEPCPELVEGLSKDHWRTHPSTGFVLSLSKGSGCFFRYYVLNLG
jgi:hypothetical protein